MGSKPGYMTWGDRYAYVAVLERVTTRERIDVSVSPSYVARLIMAGASDDEIADAETPKFINGRTQRLMTVRGTGPLPPMDESVSVDGQRGLVVNINEYRDSHDLGVAEWVAIIELTTP